MKTSIEVGPDGRDRLIRRWPNDDAHAQLVTVHGLGEHSGRWEHVGSFFAERGFAVTAFDLRGHGASGGDRVHLEDFDEFLDDLGHVLDGLRQDLPTIVYGHSMGGLITLSYGVSDRSQPALYVLSAPAVDAEVPLYLRLAARILGRVAPRIRLANSIKGEQVSRDPAVGERYFADPLVEEKATTQFGRVFLGRLGSIGAELDHLTTPTLVIHGADDPLVPPQASAPLAAVAGVERKLFPGLRHEIHNEPEQGEVLGFVANWLASQLA